MKELESQYKPSESCLIVTGRVPPPDICFVNALFDDMEGIAVLRTDNSEEGRMEYWVAPDYVDEFYQLFDAIKKQSGIEMELGEIIPESTEIVEMKAKMKRTVE